MMSPSENVRRWLAGHPSPYLDKRAALVMTGERYTVIEYSRLIPAPAPGFVAVVASEVEALRLAYDWRHAVATVRPPGGGGWSVRVEERDPHNPAGPAGPAPTEKE